MKNELNFNVIIERLKTARELSGLSYQNLARLTGLSKSTLQRYETGAIKNIPLSRVDILASALSVTPAYLMGWDKKEVAAVNDNNLDKENEELFNSLTDEKKQQALDFLRFLQDK